MESLYRYLLYVISAVLVLAGGAPGIYSRLLGIVLRVAGFALIAYYSLTIITDIFARTLAIVGSIIAAIVSVYTASYARHKYGVPYLQLLVDSFSLSIIFTFTSYYLIEFVAFWIIAELLGFVLIAFDWLTRGYGEALEAGVKFLLVSMIPADISLFSIVALAGLEKAFTASIAEAVPAIGGNILLTILCSIGFLAKAAVAPLHFWLPDAHSLAPAPASAMLSGLMVKMGIYGLYILYRYYPINVDAYAYLLIVFGSLTAIYGGLQALVQIDIKRILAYSTISHTSVIAILLGFAKLFNIESVNIEPALYAALFYSVAHAFFKSALFMDSGFVEIVTHTRNIEKLGFISRLSPLESIAALTAVLSLIGAPPLPGFVSKFLTLLSIASSIGTPVALMLLIVIAFEIALSVGYGIRYLAVHFGSSVIKVEPLEELAIPKEMSACVIISAVMSIIVTVYLLFISWTTYTMTLIYLTAVSSLFLSVILYVIQNSQKVARLEEVWIGGARP